MGPKRKHVQDQKKSENTDFSLEDVINLGGDKADYELLQEIDEEKEVIVGKEDLDADPIKKDELRDFIKNLGIYDVMEPKDDGTEKSKKVKLLSMPGKSGDEPEATPPTPNENLKKKNKNKFKIQDDEISSTTPVGKPKGKTAAQIKLGDHAPRKGMLVKLGGKWFEHEWPNDPTDFDAPSGDVIAKLKPFAAKLLEEDVVLHKKFLESQKKSDAAWIKTVLTSGTLSDKIAALTLLIQDAPVHALANIDTLIAMVKKKGRREVLMAMDTLKDLFMTELLLDDRKLKTFDQHPLQLLDTLSSGNRDSRDKRLILWYFEDQLKERYSSFIKAIETVAHDNVAASKKKVLSTIFELLSGKPEQEKAILSMLVNKLGDPDYKIAAKTSHLLAKLVEQHPNMKFVVLVEVERLLYRPNIGEKAQYYAICFLNQMILSLEEKELAARLIQVYFSFFKVFVKKGEVDSKMLSALLTGVNRAYPYAKLEKEKMEEQMNTVYKTVHLVNFNISVQALMLLYQVMDGSDNVSDRYYTTLYKKMLDPSLKNSSKQAMFLNLIFKSIRKDQTDKRKLAFIKRLLQICCHQSAPFVCGALVLVSEVLKSNLSLLRLSKVGEDSDDEDERFEDVKEEESSEEEDSSDSSEGEGDSHVPDVTKVISEKGHTTTSSWVHRRNLGNKDEGGDYDPLHRNPLYCRAEKDCIWELKKLTNHFHPSVALFAKNVLTNEKISYPGDPLQDFTLIRFLDRFVYRNPKKKESLKENVSVLQPKRKQTFLKGAKKVAVNSDQYLEKGEENIPVDEKFFFKFFSQQAEKKKTKGHEDQSDEDVSDEEFDGFLDKFEQNIDGGSDVKFDFAGEFGKQKAKKKGKDEDDSDDDDDDDDDDDLSDEEMDFDSNEFQGEFDSDDNDEMSEDGDEMGSDIDGNEAGFDEEDIAFSDEDELEDLKPKGKKRMKVDEPDEDMYLGSKPKKGKKGKTGGDSGSLFAAAEEFSHLMDDVGSSKTNMIGSQAVSNKDKASAKQLKWESDRERWMEGKSYHSKKKFGKGKGKGFKGNQGKGKKKK